VQDGDAIRAEHLQIEVRRDSDRAVMTLRGELDLASAPALARELETLQAADPPAPLIVLDVRELEFIDSTGLRVILAANTRAREGGHEFALTQVQPQLQRLLTITRVGEHLRIVDSPDTLVA
jgi:anti-sigma B factor antagonist